MSMFQLCRIHFTLPEARNPDLGFRAAGFSALGLTAGFLRGFSGDLMAGARVQGVAKLASGFAYFGWV